MALVEEEEELLYFGRDFLIQAHCLPIPILSCLVSIRMSEV